MGYRSRDDQLAQIENELGVSPAEAERILARAEQEEAAAAAARTKEAPRQPDRGGAKNRELQRVPPREARLAAMRLRAEYGALGHQFRVWNPNDLFGGLRVLLTHVQDADEFAPPSRGPKPKRRTLLSILNILESSNLPLRTGERSPVVKEVADRVYLSEAQVRDLSRQLVDLARKFRLIP